MNTPTQIAYLEILKWHCAAEEFDRTLPGEWMCGEWIPAAGQPMSRSIDNAKALERLAKRNAAAHGCTRVEWREALATVLEFDYREKRARLDRILTGRVAVAVPGR